jgi:hypothetical protein
MSGAPTAFSCWAVHPRLDLEDVGVATPAPQRDASVARIDEFDGGVDRA